ncbi:MAG: signal recognition particle protein [bacterium]|nr:signal recognition particle protein [bacterium]
MFDQLTNRLESFFKKLKGSGRLTEEQVRETLREVKKILLEADVSLSVVRDFILRIEQKAVGQEVIASVSPGHQIIKIIHDELVVLLGGDYRTLKLSGTPAVVMVCGLQGSGKTTFCAKLALWLKERKRFPLLVAADVYRPAAIEQLVVLGEKISVPVFTGDRKNPLKIAQECIDAARERSSDVVIVDTAGRLAIDNQMMTELEKIKSILSPSDILYVADAMTGQDAVNTASEFAKRINFHGVVLTKMDGDARGGAALSIRHVTGKPLQFIGTGEKVDALEPFHPDRMAKRILGMGDVVTLVERAQKAVDEKKAAELAERMLTNTFTLEDFLEQLDSIKKMGSLQELIKMIPGIGSKIKDTEIDEKELVIVKSIIQSMTKEERRRPQIIDLSRKRRIALGSGRSIQEVNRLLNQYEQIRKMMSKMGGAQLKKGKIPFAF